MTPPLRLVLVDDQTLLRKGLRQLLELTTEFQVVAEAADGAEALEVIPAAKPDVVLLDVRLPIRSGIEVVAELRRRGELPPTLLLTTFDDDEALLAGIRAGARGFLLKDIAFERLKAAIRALAAGETLIRPAVTERILRALDEQKPEFDSLDEPEALSRRELEILRLLAGGYSNREIAELFETAEGTVKNHVSNILSKLGVRDRTRAVLKALELGRI